MHEYYLKLCQPSDDEELKDWGKYLCALRQCKKPSVGQTIDLIQKIKDLERNPLMHPRLVLSADDALKIFELAKSAIILMAEEL